VTARAHSDRLERTAAKIDNLEAAQHHEDMVRTALSSWKHSEALSATMRSRTALHSSLNRHRELSRLGEDTVEYVKQRIALVEPQPPHRIAMEDRYDRLLLPLEKSQGQPALESRLAERQQDHEAAKQRLLNVRTATSERKRAAREEREELARQRVEEHARHAHELHIAGIIRSEAACVRAARVKARVRNPRRALAEDRLAAREVERQNQLFEASMTRRQHDFSNATVLVVTRHGGGPSATTSGADDEAFPPRPPGTLDSGERVHDRPAPDP
jgi:predicted small metal-binding protein